MTRWNFTPWVAGGGQHGLGLVRLDVYLSPTDLVEPRCCWERLEGRLTQTREDGPVVRRSTAYSMAARTLGLLNGAAFSGSG